MNKIKHIWWLFVLPFVVLLVPFAVRQWQVNQEFYSMTGGGGGKDSEGERGSLMGLSTRLQEMPLPNRIRIAYTTAEEDGKYRQAVDKGTRPYREWIYELEYNRQDKTLTKRLFKGNPRPPQPATVWVWHNVSEDAIHQVAAPVLKLKTKAAFDNFKGGNLTELKRYGAWLEEPKMSNSP